MMKSLAVFLLSFTTALVVAADFDVEQCMRLKMPYCLEDLKLTQEQCDETVKDWCTPGEKTAASCREGKMKYCLNVMKLDERECNQKVAFWCQGLEGDASQEGGRKLQEEIRCFSPCCLAKWADYRADEPDLPDIVCKAMAAHECSK